jgi:2-haloacid dehalogenase
MSLKVIAFDVFGTIVDMSGVPPLEIIDYGNHIRLPEWSPLVLPESWKKLPAFPDAAAGIEMLRTRFKVVTCANGPADVLRAIFDHNEIDVDLIVPLERLQVFKPSKQAYLWACAAAGAHPSECMMVTANVPGLGDLDVARSLGMQAQAIRQGPFEGPETIIDLAQFLFTAVPKPCVRYKGFP